ncbi:hypothetical protein QYE76_053313 [Lolium multiflorum]|uniref:Uncharacterized protein n=1 Tax=Lolium multiflorum TaxID=4521 RepID=A0AAD8WJY7_LOLMU|nr:hypothetical protein QYE76_053313 [Lolium multiflorum]
MYTGENDKSRVSLVDLTDEELRDEVRRLTRLSQKDNIVLTSARPPIDLQHLPAEASTVAQCYPPTPESGVEPEDDDDSEETEDGQHDLEDSDVQGDEAPEDDARTRAMRRRKINEDLLTTAESSPSGQDDDANVIASPPPAAKSSTGLFADEDDLDLAESAMQSNPSATELTPPQRTVVAKVLVSTVNPSASAFTALTTRDHPIFATVDVVADFADQFTRLESENAQLRKAIKTSADQVLEANRLVADAQNENILLKDELKKLKKKMKDEQEARREAAIAVDEKEGALRESISSLLNATDMHIDRARMIREDSMSDALSLATESNIQVQGLLQKANGALSRLYSMIFPKLSQNKTLGEMVDTFFIESSEAIEVLKRRSRLFGSVLTFQLLMGHELGSDLEKLSKTLPVDANNSLINLEPHKQSAVICATQLLKLVDEEKNKTSSKAAADASSGQP